MIKHLICDITYPLSLNFSTSSIGLLPPISKICLKTKTWSILTQKEVSFFFFVWKYQLFAWADGCWDASQQAERQFRLRDDYNIYDIYSDPGPHQGLCSYVNCGNFWMNCSMTSLIWSASSRVGVITRAPTCRRHQLNLHRGSKLRSFPPPWQKFHLQNVQKSLVLTCIFFSFSSLFSSSSMMGMTKASVFPLPVTCSDETFSELEPSINLVIIRSQGDKKKSSKLSFFVFPVFPFSATLYFISTTFIW